MVEFDAKDEDILLFLIKNARTPLSTIAAKTGLSVSAASQRVAKLEQQAIRSYKLVLNHRAFPYDEYDIYYTLSSVSESTLRNAMKSCANSPYTTQVLTTMGYADIRMTILAKDTQHLQQTLQAAEKNFAANIRSRTILAITHKYKSKAEHFLSALFGKNIEVRARALGEVYSEAKATIDETDAVLIKALAKDPKASYASLAAAVQLTPEGVSHRVKQLEKKRVVLGYTALLDGQRLGYQWAVLLLDLQHDTAEAEKLRSYIQTHSNISSAVDTVGSYTMSVTLFGKDLAQLRKTELDIRSRFGQHITEAKLLFILDNQKYPELPEGVISV